MTQPHKRAQHTSERLHTRIVTVFTLTTIAPLVLGAIVSLVLGIWATYVETTEAQTQTAQVIGQLVGTRLEDELQRLRAAARVLGRSATSDAQTVDIVDTSCYACHAFWLTDPQGRVERQFGMLAPDGGFDAGLLNAIRAGSEYTPTAPRFDMPQATLLLAFPIRNESGVARGALVALIDIDRLVGPISRLAGLNDTGYGYMVDTSGRLIVAWNAAEAPAGSDLSALPIVAAALNHQVWRAPYSQAYTGLMAQRVNGTWATAPGTGWFTIVEMPLAAASTTNWYFFASQGLLLLGTLATTVVLGRRLAATITRPIEQLGSGVARLRAGHWDQPLRIGRRDEIGQLAEAFNTMASDLESKQRELEQRGDQLALANLDLKQALESAHAANMLKSQFVATISHELRTPLTGVLGYTDMLDMGVFGQLDAEQHNVVGRIRDNGKHLLQLINDLLDFSKLEAGKLELRPEPFLLREFVSATLAQCEPQARTKGLRLESHCDPALPRRINADVLRLRQIVLNLLSNAIKFTEHGQVILELSYPWPAGANGRPHHANAALPDEEILQISVSDTGIGIARDHQVLIFDAFLQLDGGYSRRSEGTGLGLAITRRLVDVMGGTIQLESELGHGSRFIVQLPLVPAPDIAMPAGIPEHSH